MVKFNTPKLNIKSLLRLVAVAIAVLALLAIAGAAYNRSQAQAEELQNKHKAALNAEYERGVADGQKDRKQYLASWELMRNECTKGVKNYALLTTNQKRTALAINCEQPVLQFP